MSNDYEQTAKLNYDGKSMQLTSGTNSWTIGDIGDLNAWSGATYYPWATYHPYDRTIHRESKIDTAFKIIEKLMDKGHIKELTVKEFTKLVKEIADTL